LILKCMRYLSLFLFIFFLLLTSHIVAQKPAATYYVGANAGLNMRATASTTGEKLATALYGEAVEIIAPAADQNMVVDGIKGGMAQVKHEGKTGYMFDGYLLRLPPPTKGEEVEQYVGRLWTAEADVLHEELRRDWGGYAQFTYALYFKEISWAEAFVIAKNLFGIPAPLQFPGEKGSGESTVKNPNAAVAWTDELQIVYGTSGKLQKIVYAFRSEGSGQVITIEPTTESGYTMKISELSIAD
jgi:hypothetical protein